CLIESKTRRATAGFFVEQLSTETLLRAPPRIAWQPRLLVLNLAAPSASFEVDLKNRRVAAQRWVSIQAQTAAALDWSTIFCEMDIS
ncbi:hypothetical protein, partial [Mesorhizobium sp. M4B.F.Ca.ET.172.01.1.1]|uniref:hypothetical protein n=1 Tax=Mesorhizobium sp. M4B.F.Ca.ET.172.01.1.1 TaxID=2563950 RepID=UPI001AEDC17D